jgi:DNA ligase (NAD+)
MNSKDFIQLKKLLKVASDSYYNSGKFFKVPVEKLTPAVASVVAYGTLVRGRPVIDETKSVTRKFLEITDARYDLIEAVLRQQEPANKLLAQTRSPVGVKQVEVKLPYLMPSLDKKFYGDGSLAKWTAKYPGPYVISDKLDGVSMELLAHDGVFDKLYKGGSATHGMDWSHAIPHLKLPKKAPAGTETGVRAEIIMSKKEFDAKWAGKYKNSRNLTSGIVNKTRGMHEAIGSVEPVVFDVLHKRMKPSAALAWAKSQGFKTAHHILANKISEEQLLKYLRTREKADHLIDGLVIAQDKPYALTERNPLSMIAFKAPSEGNYAETTITEIEWRPSRHGLLVPRFTVEPVKLSGVTVTHAAAHNAQYVVENKLNVGSVIGIIRSGEVIPYVQDVIKASRTASLPDKSIVGEYKWDANKTHLVLVEQGSSDASKIKAIAHFFAEGLEVDDLGVGVVKQLYEAGYDTVGRILKLRVKDLLNLAGWQQRKAEKIVGNIQRACIDANLIKVMAGSGVLGPLLGERKLTALYKSRPKLFDMSVTHTEKQLTLALQDVPGFKDKSAAPIIANLAKCFKWIDSLPITFKKPEAVKVVGKKMAGQTVVFTGVRSAQAEEEIAKQGGKIGTGVSGTTTILVAKDPNASSLKLDKARSLGIKVMSLHNLNTMLGI